MSTKIKTIKGRYEESTNGDFTSNYETSKLHINRFYGGKKNGRMLQLTINQPNVGYIQLTQDQVKDLIETLQNSFNDEIYPSE